MKMVTSSLVISKAGIACPSSCTVTVTKKAKPNKRINAIMERNPSISGLFWVKYADIAELRNKRSKEKATRVEPAGVNSLERWWRDYDGKSLCKF
jgi:hypothetical protein